MRNRHPFAYSKNLISRWNVEEAHASTDYFLYGDDAACPGGRTGNRDFGICPELGAARSVRGALCSAGPVEQFPPPVMFGPSNLSIESPSEAESRVETESRGETAPSAETRPVELGAASFQDSYGVAQLAAGLRARQGAKRLYSNLDIERMNQMTGMVEYEGKTEHLE